MVVELNYAIALTSWLTIQPAVQYIMNPAGLDDVSDAVVIGAQIIVNL
jgi:porin